MAQKAENPAQMVELTTRDEVEAWLEGRPHEVAVILAARAALRVAPLLVTALVKDDKARRAAIILPSLRAMAAAWFAGTRSNHGAEVLKAVRASANAAYVVAGNAGYVGKAVYVVAAADASASAYAYGHTGACARAAEASAHASTASAEASAKASAEASAYRAFSLDATEIEQGVEVPVLSAAPLWRDDAPDWATEHWSALQQALSKAPEENWQAWTVWYERRLQGAPVNIPLEEARVLIDPDLWDAGPAAVNTALWELEKNYATTIAGSSDSDDGDANLIVNVLDETPLRAALADYRFDELEFLMRRAAFADDLADLKEEAERAEAERALEAIRQDAIDLADDLERFPTQLDGELCAAAKRYASAALGLDNLNPRYLWSKGSELNDFRLDEFTLQVLGERRAKRLSRLVDQHLDLMRHLFASALERMLGSDSIRLKPGATIEQVAEGFGMTADALTQDWSPFPPPEPNLDLYFRQLREEVLRQAAFRHSISDPNRRAIEDAELEKKSARGVAEAFRYGLRAASYGVGAVNTVAAAKSLWPESYAEVLEHFKSLFDGVPLN